MSEPMLLLDFPTIVAQLDERFIPHEPLLTGMRLVTKSTHSGELNECMRLLGLDFPESFGTLITKYDFGNFTLGPIVFGHDGNYLRQLLEANLETSSLLAWWGRGTRPREFLLIGGGDNHALVLNCDSGQILSFRNGEIVPCSLFVVADSFELLVRGAATAMLTRNPAGGNDQLCGDIAMAVGVEASNPFWRWVAA